MCGVLNTEEENQKHCVIIQNKIYLKNVLVPWMDFV